jgi:uncharacterized membrane protein
MDFTNDILFKIAVFILGAIGFWVASHVYKHKKRSQPLVCPIQFDCNTVINSDYSKFFGIPVEILGMIYYGLIALAYLSLILFPGMWAYEMVMILTGASLAAFVFSLYLIWVQIFALRKGCSWCIFSAILSTMIFFCALQAHGLSVSF